MPSEALASAVLTQAWQVAAVATVVAVAARLLGRGRPHLSLLLWTLVFVKCLTPPAWSSPLGLFSWLQLRVQSPVAVSPADGQAPTSGAFLATSAPRAIHADDLGVGDRRRAMAADVLLAVWIAGVVGTAGLALLGWRRAAGRSANRSSNATRNCVRRSRSWDDAWGWAARSTQSSATARWARP